MPTIRKPIFSSLPWRSSGQGGLRSEFVLEEGDLENSPDPFVPLTDTGRYSRVLLCRIALKDRTLQNFALRIQKSAFRPAGKMRIQSSVSNPQIEDMWRTEAERLRRASGPHVQGLMELGATSELSESPPVTFCKKTRQFFHPPCPDTLEPLRTCRDDRLLIDHGLRPWSTSAERYLVSSSPRPKVGSPTTFYRFVALTGEQPRSSAEVRVGTDLYRDFSKIIHGELEEHDSKALAPVFPCLQCDYREECYPKDVGPSDVIPAETRLSPLSYYDFMYLALEAFDCEYGDLVDLVGGAPPQVILDRVEGSSTRGRLQLLGAALPARSGADAWLFRHDPKRFPLEVLRLKLQAFRQLCLGLSSVHACTGAPHLDVCSASIPVQFLPVASGFQANWAFSLSLGNLGMTVPWREEGVAPLESLEVFVPAPDADQTCQSPLVSQSAFGEEHAMRVTVTKALHDGERLQLRMEARVPAGSRIDRYRTGDLVRLTSHGTVARQPLLQLWAKIDQKTGGMFRLSADLPAIGSPSDWEGKPVFDAGVAFYRRFGVPCDLFGAGSLLLRSVLSNDQQVVDSVQVAVRSAIDRVELRLDLRRDAVVDFAEARASVLAQIAKDREGVFRSNNVLYARSDRETDVDPIPGDVWEDVLLLAFRMMTNLAGFGFCRDHGDFDLEDPGGVMDKIVREVDGLIGRIDCELFDAAARDEELGVVCREILQVVSGIGR